MIPVDLIRDAAAALKGRIVRTPLLRLPLFAEGPEIYLKLETLQPIGSFKIRGAMNLVRSLPPEELAAGVWTASAGNMAQGAAWAAREAGVACTVVVPESAPETKLRAVAGLGARIVKESFDRWWRIFQEQEYPGMRGRFIHPFDDDLVMAGNGTIGLEILEDLPEADTVLVPWGGGGLASGIAAAMRSLQPAVRIYAAECATSAPLAASLAAGSPRRVVRIPSFVDGIAGTEVFPRMFALARELLDGSLVAELTEIEEAIRVLVERSRIVAEGAGACGLALALRGRAPGKKIVCVVSGGNIDASELARILNREPAVPARTAPV